MRVSSARIGPWSHRPGGLPVHTTRWKVMPKREHETRRLPPSTMKRPWLLFSLLVTAGSSLFAQVDTGRPTGGTPYDSYHGPVRAVYARCGSAKPSIDEVRAQIR